jgi:hypothetical protein
MTDIDLSGATPSLTLFPAKSRAVIECQLVEQGLDGPQLTERQVRVGLTIDDAMALLAQLSEAQRLLTLPEPGAVTITAVSPEAADGEIHG